jgi:hypothetical protein
VAKCVLILGSPEDEHAQHVAEKVGERGLEVHWLDGRLFPGEMQIALEPGVGGHLRTAAGTSIPFTAVESVYWRSYFAPAYPELPNAEQADLAFTDSQCLLHSLLIELPARWVNGWAGFQAHQRKPAALAQVKRLALQRLRIPETLCSNDPEALRGFVERVGDCIFKPVHGGAHTRRLSPAHLQPDTLQRLRYAPVTIQQEIRGTDIRVFLAGERTLACEIQTAALDFRDDEDPRIIAIDLPADVRADCQAIARSLHLLWTGIDLRRTEAGDYFYFEANPSPMFLGFESRCELPITEALVDLLVGKERPR